MKSEVKFPALTKFEKCDNVLTFLKLEVKFAAGTKFKRGEMEFSLPIFDYTFSNYNSNLM
ncbi:hypothetical protein AFK68_21365 [Hydrocoleum sp. CS-953]|nr:hypothetical protein AFK68_21365 [Hydrocoleum sp. CS-953]